MFNKIFPPKSRRLLDNVENYDTTRQASHDYILLRKKNMRFACRIINTNL